MSKELQYILNAKKDTDFAIQKAENIITSDIISESLITEKKRDEIFSLVSITIFVLLALSFFVIYYFKGTLMYFDIQTLILLAVLALLISGLIIILVFDNRNSKYKKILKEKYRPLILNVFMNFSSYTSSNALDKDVITDAINLYHSKTSDDTFFATYKNMECTIDEMQLIKNGGKSSYTVFKGLGVKIHLPEKCFNIKSGYIKIFKNPKSENIQHIFGALLFIILFICTFTVSAFSNEHYFKIVFFAVFVFYVLQLIKNLEIINDKTFKNLKINTSEYLLKFDNSEYYDEIITNEFLELLSDIEKRVDSSGIAAIFQDNTFHFFFLTEKNLFEIGNILDSANDVKVYKECVKEISAVFELVSYFSYKFNG